MSRVAITQSNKGSAPIYVGTRVRHLDQPFAPSGLVREISDDKKWAYVIFAATTSLWVQITHLTR